MVIAIAVFSIICLAIGVRTTISKIRESTDKNTTVENSVLCTLWIIMIICDIIIIIGELL